MVSYLILLAASSALFSWTFRVLTHAHARLHVLNNAGVGDSRHSLPGVKTCWQLSSLSCEFMYSFLVDFNLAFFLWSWQFICPKTYSVYVFCYQASNLLSSWSLTTGTILFLDNHVSWCIKWYWVLDIWLHDRSTFTTPFSDFRVASLILGHPLILSCHLNHPSVRNALANRSI